MEEKRMRVSPSKEQADYLKFIGAFEAPAPSPALAPDVSKVRPAASRTDNHVVPISTPSTFFTACCVVILVILLLLLMGS
jgi:hypothetical protein